MNMFEFNFMEVTPYEITGAGAFTPDDGKLAAGQRRFMAEANI